VILSKRIRRIGLLILAAQLAVSGLWQPAVVLAELPAGLSYPVFQPPPDAKRKITPEEFLRETIAHRARMAQASTGALEHLASLHPRHYGKLSASLLYEYILTRHDLEKTSQDPQFLRKYGLEGKPGIAEQLSYFYGVGRLDTLLSWQRKADGSPKRGKGKRLLSRLDDIVALKTYFNAIGKDQSEEFFREHNLSEEDRTAFRLIERCLDGLDRAAYAAKEFGVAHMTPASTFFQIDPTDAHWRETLLELTRWFEDGGRYQMFVDGKLRAKRDQLSAWFEMSQRGGCFQRAMGQALLGSRTPKPPL
jgi:hypothetical protein